MVRMMCGIRRRVGLPRILHVCFPSRGPFNQLAPIATFMFCAKACHAANLSVFNLNSSIWLAHQTMP